MADDSKLRRLAAMLAIPAVLLAIGASYERGGIAGLRDLTGDLLHSVGLTSKASRPNMAAPTAGNPSATLAPDEVFWLSIKDSRAPGLYEEFLKKFPDSRRANEARARLETLAKAPHDGVRPPINRQGHGPMMMGRDRGG
jgi:hypothetical protein